jgi:hypothetical protein
LASELPPALRELLDEVIEWDPRPVGDRCDLSGHWCLPGLGEGGGMNLLLDVAVHAGGPLIPVLDPRSAVPRREDEAVLAGGGGR